MTYESDEQIANERRCLTMPKKHSPLHPLVFDTVALRELRILPQHQPLMSLSSPCLPRQSCFLDHPFLQTTTTVVLPGFLRFFTVVMSC
jgi:hypothetical protein